MSQDLERRHKLVHEKSDYKVGKEILTRYAFNHILFQLYIYNRLGMAEQKFLHREIAGTLEKLYEGHTEEIAIELVYHYTKANDAEKLRYYLRLAGDFTFKTGDFKQAREFYTQAIGMLEFIRNEEEKIEISYLLWCIGNIYQQLALWQEAEPYFRKSIAYAEDVNRNDLIARGLIYLANSLRRQRKSYNEAQTVLEEALKLSRQSNNRAYESQALRMQGIIYGLLDDVVRRIETIDQAYKIAIEIEDISMQRSCLNSMGATYSGIFGDYPKAIRCFLDALQIALNQHNKNSQAINMGNLFAYRKIGLPQKAKEFVNSQLRILNEIGNISTTHDVYRKFGILLLHEGKLQEAVDNLTKSKEIADQYNRHLGSIQSRSWLIITSLKAENIGSVEQLIKEQEPLLSKANTKNQVFNEKILEGIFLLRTEKETDAQSVFENELEHSTKGLKSQRHAYRYHRAFAQLGLSLLAPEGTRRENLQQTRKFFQEAVDYCGWAGVLEDALLILDEFQKIDSDNVLDSIRNYLVDKRDIARSNIPSIS